MDDWKYNCHWKISRECILSLASVIRLHRAGTQYTSFNLYDRNWNGFKLDESGFVMGIHW